MRYFLDISYNGEAYHGWQVQENANTVQGEVNRALRLLLSQEVKTIGSGRTDTGVHAIQQIAHLDTPLQLMDDFGYKLNAILPSDISVNDVYRVKSEAHARFDAISRTYIYKIHCKKEPFFHGRSYFFTRALDLDCMNEAAGILCKYQDYQCFSKVNTNFNHFLCTIQHLSLIHI